MVHQPYSDNLYSDSHDVYEKSLIDIECIT